MEPERLVRKLPILLIALICLCDAGPARAAPIAPHLATHAQIRHFVSLLNKTDGEHEFVSSFTSDGYALISFADGGMDEGNYRLWIADVNNDGSPDYFWATEDVGAGNYDYFDVYRLRPDKEGKLVKIKFPWDSDHEMPSNLADPPIDQDEKGTTYLNLKDTWAEDAQGNRQRVGMMDIKLYVVVTTQYRWDKSGLTLVYKQTVRTTNDLGSYH